MLIHGMIEESAVNGPGERAVVWLQGCTLNCPGCWNRETHDLNKGHESEMSPPDLATKLLDIEDICGVTFSGGEPLHQLLELNKCAAALKARTGGRFSIGIYTGYEEQELTAGRFDAYSATGEFVGRGDSSSWEWKRVIWHNFSKKLDFAVHGRFNQDKPSKLPMRSSQNQSLRLYSSRYSEANFPTQAAEVHFNNGLVRVTGFPSPVLLNTL